VNKGNNDFLQLIKINCC